MKDHRFIELVNLYIDRQITDAETTELEAEMQAHPRRRTIYRQYCQMHRATTLVYESFQHHASSQQPEIVAGKATIARLESRPQNHGIRWAYYAGGLAAACLALVLLRLNFPRTADAGLAATSQRSSPSAAGVASLPPVSTVRREADAARPGLVSLPNSNLAVEQDYTAMLAALRQEEQRTAATGQLQPGRLPSLFDDGVFEFQQVSPANSQRVFRGRQTSAQPAEFTAFQFQR
jgi:hypothetical protein